jgi:hypothetical protein
MCSVEDWMVRWVAWADGPDPRHPHVGLLKALIRQWPARHFPTEGELDAFCVEAGKMWNEKNACHDWWVLRSLAVKAFNPGVPMSRVVSLVEQLDYAGRVDLACRPGALPWQNWEALTDHLGQVRNRGLLDEYTPRHSDPLKEHPRPSTQ